MRADASCVRGVLDGRLVAPLCRRTIHKEVKRKFPRGHDLFYHNNPVMGPHSWGGATKTHIAFLNQNAKKTLDATYE